VKEKLNNKMDTYIFWIDKDNNKFPSILCLLQRLINLCILVDILFSFELYKSVKIPKG